MHSRSRHVPPARSQQGFTLLEVVAAFAVLALGLALAMQAATGAMQQSRQAAEHPRAALHAQSVLDTLGVGAPIEEGSYDGEFDDGYSWVAEVTEYQVAMENIPEGIDPLNTPVVLLRVDLAMRWPHGEQTAEARFSTLKAMMPAQP